VARSAEDRLAREANHPGTNRSQPAQRSLHSPGYGMPPRFSPLPGALLEGEALWRVPVGSSVGHQYRFRSRLAYRSAARSPAVPERRMLAVLSCDPPKYGHACGALGAGCSSRSLQVHSLCRSARHELSQVWSNSSHLAMSRLLRLR